MFSESSRRNFLQAVPAAAAATSALPFSAAAAPAAGDIKLGIASYSFREFGRRLCIKYTKELGITLLTIKEFHALYRSTPQELASAKNDFAKAGITLTGGGTVYMLKDDDADVKSYFDYAKALGMPMMNIGTTAKIMPTVEKYAKQYDIKIAVHNHGPEDKNFPAPSDALKVIKDMDPRMGVCIDVGHTTRTGKNVLEEIQAAGPRLLDMHVKDLKDLMNRDSQCDVGEGAMPIVDIFKLLKKMNYQGTVHLEYEINADNPLLGMHKSFSYMRGVNAALRA
ncbi:MAG: sugar phosphate isomerase/epimerase [Acidobacteria bacterium]|nr:sugar phosphate isomerase/epimerase [Acidobacteriota bacterium]